MKLHVLPSGGPTFVGQRTKPSCPGVKKLRWFSSLVFKRFPIKLAARDLKRNYRWHCQKKVGNKFRSLKQAFILVIIWFKSRPSKFLLNDWRTVLERYLLATISCYTKCCIRNKTILFVKIESWKRWTIKMLKISAFHLDKQCSDGNMGCHNLRRASVRNFMVFHSFESLSMKYSS